MFSAEHAHSKFFEWPEGVLEACSHFQQGDVIEMASLAFSFDARYPVTAMAKERATGKNVMTGTRVDVQYAMITSQTCNLAGKRGKKYPFVLLAPVYDLAGKIDRGQEKQIADGKFGEFIPLDGPRFAHDGELWVADLRFETALEKGVLVDREPIDAFSNDAGYLRARQKIGRSHFRPAISENVETHVLDPLRDKWRAGELEPEAIKEFMVKATPKTVSADAVRLYVIVRGGFNVDELQEQYAKWHAEVAEAMPEGLQFLGIEVVSENVFTWADFDGLEIANPMELSADDDL